MTGKPTGRTLGGWLPDTGKSAIRQVLGSSWNGSFGVAIVPATGVAVAIASNIEFDQPADLIARIIDLWDVPREALP